MAEIIKTYRQSVPAMRFIGKIDRGNGRGWGEWHGNGWFGVIEAAEGGEAKSHRLYEDADAYLGLLHIGSDSKVIEYWIGKLTAPGTEVPEGFGFIDYPARALGTAWIKGKDMRDIMKSAREVAGKLEEAGMEIIREADGSHWCIERYGCPRYTTPDAEGNVIVDYCYFVK